jgi:putative iron-dependent peroxidase
MTAAEQRAPGTRAPTPQPVVSPLTESAIFLVMTIDPGAEADVRDLLSDLAGLQRTVGFREPDGGLAVVAGIGAEAWDRLYSGPRPRELHPLGAVRGTRHHAVSTPGDVLFHIRARQMDLCFELASQITGRLGPALTVVDETHGFRYFDVRDLLGFVDGTENPVGPAAEAAVTIGVEDPQFAGASYVVVQKYVHDLATWNALPVEEQERVIGRTKLTNVELPDEVKPSNSHVALNTITGPDGEQRQVLRDNMPFGTVGTATYGTYYIAYSSAPSVTEEMLQHMFIGDPPGNYDRILDFSTPVTGTLFFVPTTDFLEDPPPPPGAAAPASARLDHPHETVDGEGSGPSAADESLGIGGLRRDSPTR